MKNFFRYLFTGKEKPDLDRFELYRTFNSDVEAYIAKGVLETNGIYAQLEGNTLSSVYPHLGFSELRLYIRRADFLMADQLLEENRDKALS